MRNKTFRIALVLTLVLVCGVVTAVPALAAGPADDSFITSRWGAWSDLGTRLIGWWTGFAALAPEHTAAASGHGMDPNGSPEPAPTSGHGMDPDGSPTPTPASGSGMDPNG